MIPKTFQKTFKYNDLLMPKEDRQINDNINFELWRDLMVINSNYPQEEIRIDRIVKDF